VRRRKEEFEEEKESEEEVILDDVSESLDDVDDEELTSIDPTAPPIGPVTAGEGEGEGEGGVDQTRPPSAGPGPGPGAAFPGVPSASPTPSVGSGGGGVGRKREGGGRDRDRNRRRGRNSIFSEADGDRPAEMEPFATTPFGGAAVMSIEVPGAGEGGQAPVPEEEADYVADITRAAKMFEEELAPGDEATRPFPRSMHFSAPLATNKKMAARVKQELDVLGFTVMPLMATSQVVQEYTELQKTVLQYLELQKMYRKKALELLELRSRFPGSGIPSTGFIDPALLSSPSGAPVSNTPGPRDRRRDHSRAPRTDDFEAPSGNLSPRKKRKGSTSTDGESQPKRRR